jgi:hypothetical protein
MMRDTPPSVGGVDHDRAALSSRVGGPGRGAGDRGCRTVCDSRQAVHRWVGWYRDEGLDGLADISSRPHASPTQTPPEVDAAICELRRNYPR